MNEKPKDFIHFFGTTGSKFTYFKKIRDVGGIYINVDGIHLIVDPGINTFYKYINTYKDDEVDGILLSHIHMDHSNDLNVFVELMTNGGQTKRGTLILPKQAIEEKILHPYAEKFPDQVYVIEPNTTYKIKDLEITTSIRLKHGVENYGFKVKTKKHNIGIVTDTEFFEELIDSYKNCNILIMNVPYYIKENDRPYAKHLDIPATEKFIQQIKPKEIVLTHFSGNMLNNNPELIAENLSKKYNIKVIAAKDDMILEL